MKTKMNNLIFSRKKFTWKEAISYANKHNLRLASAKEYSDYFDWNNLPTKNWFHLNTTSVVPLNKNGIFVYNKNLQVLKGQIVHSGKNRKLRAIFIKDH